MSERLIVYRVQDCEGRGPWKPGVSSRWMEPRDRRHLQPNLCMLMNALGKASRRSSIGYGTRTIEALRIWFTPGEYATVRGLGYHAVMLQACRILEESKLEVVFERRQPFGIGAVPVELYATEEARL